MRIPAKILSFIFLIILGIFMLQLSPVLAQPQRGAAPGMWDNIRGMIAPIGEGFGYRAGTPPDIRLIVASIIRIFILLLSSIFLALVVYGGFVWMIAQGESDKVQKGKDIIRMGIVGLVIIFSAYAISRFVVLSVFCSTRSYSDFCLFFTRII